MVYLEVFLAFLMIIFYRCSESFKTLKGMKKKIVNYYKKGAGYIVEVAEKTFFWKFKFSKKKLYFVDDFGCYHYPSYSPVLNISEKNFV